MENRQWPSQPEAHRYDHITGWPVDRSGEDWSGEERRSRAPSASSRPGDYWAQPSAAPNWPQRSPGWHPAQRPQAATRRPVPPAYPGNERARAHAGRVASAAPRAAWLSVLTWTVGCFVVPMLFYLAWAWTRSGTVPPSCLDFGRPCVSLRTAALSRFIGALPGVATAVVLSLLAAAGLRHIGNYWRPATVAVSSAIIGAGVATLIVTSI